MNNIQSFLSRVNYRNAQLNQVLFGSRNAKSLSQWHYYLTKQPIAGYIGWLGHKNLGDEILYLAFKKLFEPVEILTYGSSSYQDHENNLYPIELLLYRYLIKYNNFFNFVFLGGGTLINQPAYIIPLKNALQHEKRVIVFGTGVRDPSFWSKYPSHGKSASQMRDWVAVLKDAASIKVRGPKSARILEAYGLPKPDFISDPALSLCLPKPLDTPRNRRVGINLGCHKPMWGSQEEINAVVAKLSKYLLETGWQVEFIPMHPIDLEVGIKFIRDYQLENVSIRQDFQDWVKTINRIQSYDLLIGQRLHSVVLACGCGVPAISLEYEPKCGDFMESIGMQKFLIRTDQINFDKLLELFHNIELNYLDTCRNLVLTCDRYRLLQAQAAKEVLDQLLK